MTQTTNQADELPGGVKLEPQTTPDCTFLYFKPTGKWKYEGRGVFPREDVTRETIFSYNEGMPGINGDGKPYTIVVVPDENCDAPFAYPRLLISTEEWK